jgi:CheY-like chemotaxis protein
MAALRVVHVDDEPDIREIVKMCLNLDPEMEMRSCASGQDALDLISGWTPDVILLDVMMPTMDGPATFARLKENAQTAAILVVFMTARVQARELDRLLAMGAVDVIAKPFDPMSLAAKVRGCVRAADPLEALRTAFVLRTDQERTELSRLHALSAASALPEPALAGICSTAHRIAGAGGIFGFPELSKTASVLEETILADDPAATPVEITDALGRLIAAIERKR